jgi:nucleoside-diphosphate-sugar epimerase
MFGWFDPKHLGWLARFMERVPFFPVPGHGRYMRQPLYNRDFCRAILAMMQHQPEGAVYDLTGPRAKLMHAQAGLSELVEHVAFSPDGTRVVVTLVEGRCRSRSLRWPCASMRCSARSRPSRRTSSRR